MLEDTKEIADFHAHVYYDCQSREVAARVREELSTKFDVRLGRCMTILLVPIPNLCIKLPFYQNNLVRLFPG